MRERPDIQEVLAVALAAGEAVMAIYAKDFAVDYKEDSSPLTEADRKAHAIIVEGLRRLGEVPILSEEGRDIPYEERKTWERYWCVDPIDGTKEFIKKNGEFTVNIALIEGGEPTLGVVYAPAMGEIYWGRRGEGAWKASLQSGERWQPEAVRRQAQALPDREAILRRRERHERVVVASKSHLNDATRDFIEGLEQPGWQLKRLSRGSSLKLLMVAEGVADIYPRLAPTMEWDTAAADAIVREAGGMVWEYNPSRPPMAPLRYNKENLLNPSFLVTSPLDGR